MRPNTLPTTAAALTLTLATASVALGQVFEFTVGSSSLLRAHGGSLVVHGDRFTGRFGVGLRDPDRSTLAGMSIETRFHDVGWRIGDQTLPLDLPTDVFVRSHQFIGRGVSATSSTPRRTVLLYAGATSTGYATPYFQGAASRTPTGLVFYDRRLSQRWRVVSRNVVAERRTSIQAVEWAPWPTLELGLAGGVGNDQGYGAASANLDGRILAMHASYVHAGGPFRRLPAGEYTIPEADGENLRIVVTPRTDLRMTISRRSYVSPSRAKRPETRATVNEATTGMGFLSFQTHASLFLTEGGGHQPHGLSLGASRRLPGGMDAGITWFRSGSSAGTRRDDFVVRIGETLSPRMKLTQVMTVINDQVSVSWGGRLRLSRVLISLDYQTRFLPLATEGRSGFQQILFLDVRLPLPGSMQLAAGTQVDPTGQTRYTGYVSGVAYGRPIAGSSGHRMNEVFDGHVLRGTVVDTAGAPIPGAAVRVDGVLVFTNSQGVFEARRSRAKRHLIEIALVEFMFPGRFEVVSAPATVRAGAAGDATECRIVLRRLP